MEKLLAKETAIIHICSSLTLTQLTSSWWWVLNMQNLRSVNSRSWSLTKFTKSNWRKPANRSSWRRTNTASSSTQLTLPNTTTSQIETEHRKPFMKAVGRSQIQLVTKNLKLEYGQPSGNKLCQPMNKLVAVLGNKYELDGHISWHTLTRISSRLAEFDDQNGK